MDILQSIVLGIIQGLTEFFPVSSSGHMVLMPYLLGWDYPPLYYTVTLHFATLLSLVTVFYKDIFRILRALFRAVFVMPDKRDPYFKLGIFLIIASIPSAIAGFLLEDQIESLFSKPLIVSMFFVTTAIILGIGEWKGRAVQKKVGGKGTNFNFLNSIVVGLAQALAILPGISRSGVTISSGRFFGISREDSVRFSFLLSIPVILGSFIFELISSRKIIFSNLCEGNLVWVSLISGFVFSYLSGLLAIKFLLRFTRTKNLNVFGFYCIFVSVIIFLVYFFKNF